MTETKAVTLRPMKAETFMDEGQLKSWPYLGSRKLDGLRCLIVDGVALSANLEPLRNKYVQEVLGRRELNGLDGELIVGSATGGNVLGRSMGVMAIETKPDFTFWAFDDFSAHAHGFSYRIGRVEDRVDDIGSPRVKLVEHEMLESTFNFRRFEGAAIQAGYEGVMLRHPDGPYKYGRATSREDWLWKVKRFIDGEAEVVGVEEGFVNENPLDADAMGLAKRSTKKELMVPSGRVGTLIGRDLKSGRVLRISPGRMPAAERIALWQDRAGVSALGRLAKYKAFDYGLKDELRFVTFEAWRDPADMDKPFRRKAGL